MHNVLVDGGTIRKLWIGESAKYRDHLLRLDPESRRNRFGGAVSDEFIENFVELTPASTPSSTASSWTGCSAVPPSCERSGLRSPMKPKPRSRSRSRGKVMAWVRSYWSAPCLPRATAA